ISDTGDIGFTSTIDGAFALTVDAANGTVDFGGSVGGGTALASLTVDPESIILGGTTYHTSGDQSYGAPVRLARNVSLLSDNGDIGFTSTIDGAHSLSATATTGTIDIGGTVGGPTALSSLTLAAAGGVDLVSAFTTGAQHYTSAGGVTLDGSY